MHAQPLSLFSAVAGLSLLAAACGGDNLTLPSDGEAAHIAVWGPWAENAQQGRVGTEVSEPLAVRVTDTQDRPVIGATVQFVVEDGSGSSADPVSVTTADSGIARTSVVLGPRVGTVTGLARVVVPEGQTPIQTEFVATALSADANQIALVSGDPQSAPVGTRLPSPLVVQVTDQFGNPISGVTVNWTVEGGGSVSAPSTQTDITGQTSVERTLGPIAGPQTTTASAVDLVGSPIVFSHTAQPGNAARVTIVSGNNQEASPGSELHDELVVEVLDEANNPIVGRAVAWVVGAGGGSADPETSNTNAQGRASTRWTLGPSQGRNTLSAVVSGVGRADFVANTSRASSNTDITSHQPEPSTVGQPVEVRVQVSSSAGTPTGTVNVTGENAAGPCTIALANGAGACSLTFNAPGQQRITATYGGDNQFTGSNDNENHRVEPAAPQNTPPTAAFNPPTNCVAGQPCQFNDGSSDSDGNVVGWLWEFGDGGTSDQKDPTHMYAAPGNYNVKLTVRDDDAATAEITHTVSVSAAPNFPPVATDDSYITSHDTPFHAPDGTQPGLLQNDADLEGEALTATPASGTTTAGGTFNVAGDGSFDYSPPPGFTGPDSFDYTVNDSSGGSDTGTAHLTVQ